MRGSVFDGRGAGPFFGKLWNSCGMAVSNDRSITINRIHDVTIVSTRDRNTGKVTSETFFGDSPYGK
jgi:hypothetical protein